MTSIELGKLTIDVNEGDKKVVYKFSGDVDENFEQNKVLVASQPLPVPARRHTIQ